MPLIGKISYEANFVDNLKACVPVDCLMIFNFELPSVLNPDLGSDPKLDL
jgi:hypothetical protein